ncbi:MAG: tetratricopeptide repeat protein, partial [Candidatus Methylomirabilales bacterium]
MGYVYLLQKQYERAMAELERAVVLDPNLADGYARLAETLSREGRSEEAVRMAGQALHHKPFIVDYHLINIGTAYD